MAIYYCVITGGDGLQKAFTKTKTTSGIRSISNIWINLAILHHRCMYLIYNKYNQDER